MDSVGDRKRTRTDTRERILIEASRLFSTHGYHATSTRQIAAAVGISQPSLFFHFPAKRSILDELCRFDVVPAVEGVESLVVSPGSPAAKMYALVFAETRRILQSPYDLRAHVGYEVLDDPELAEYREMGHRFDDMIRLLIRSAQESGQFATGDPWLAQQLVTGFVVRSGLFARAERVDPQRHPEESARLILRALLADPADLDTIAAEAEDLIPRYQGARDER
jgi:AcrR family transcriptional regulator